MTTEEIKQRIKEIANEGSLEKKDAMEVLKVLTEYISKSDTMKDQVQEVITEVLADYKTQMKVFIVSLTKSRISRVSSLLERLDMVEDAMYTEMSLTGLDKKILLNLHSTLTSSLRSVVDLAILVNTLDIPTNPVINNYTQNNIQNNLLNLDGSTKDSRMDLRKSLGDLLTKIEQHKPNGQNGTSH